MEETEDRREEQEATDEGGDCHLGSGGGGSKGGGGGGGGGGGSAARSTQPNPAVLQGVHVALPVRRTHPAAGPGLEVRQPHVAWLEGGCSRTSGQSLSASGIAPTECHSLVLKRIRLAKAAALCTGVGVSHQSKACERDRAASTENLYLPDSGVWRAAAPHQLHQLNT
ncbi:hypothetical protein AOLI_G00160750 [Acnodon oligacanthus]